ncbi:MAG TPA: RtcB family protein [Polyangiales bacterium]|nr:RtcB family protein [Polyangiales bacterium]
MGATLPLIIGRRRCAAAPRLADRLREESPAAYKDIGRVTRAQRELTRIVRRLEPLLVYKAP